MRYQICVSCNRRITRKRRPNVRKRLVARQHWYAQKRNAGFALASEPAGGRRLVLDSVVTVAGRDTAGGVETARAGATFAVAPVLAVVAGAGEAGAEVAPAAGAESAEGFGAAT